MVSDRSKPNVNFARGWTGMRDSRAGLDGEEPSPLQHSIGLSAKNEGLLDSYPKKVFISFRLEAVWDAIDAWNANWADESVRRDWEAMMDFAHI